MAKLVQLVGAFSRLSCSGASPTLRMASTPSLTFIRNTNFFNKHSAEHIWKSITSTSPQGKKRGRGRKSRKLVRNLNRGQIIGVGRANIVWPGLTSPIIQGKEVVKQHKLPPDPEYESRLHKLRDASSGFKTTKLSPLERGWSGSKMPGRSIGPPDPVNGTEFEGFDTKVLELKSVFHMRNTVGRYRRVSVVCVTGNKNGVIGFALGKAVDGRTALRKAKNRAGQKLMFIERYNNHTVCHNFFSQFGSTKVYVQKMPEGFGLVCHRAIRTMCELIGITDMYAKVEDSKCVQSIVKAFLVGLLGQRTHQQLADEVKLHLVEFRRENGDCPRIVASPTNGCQESISEKDIPDFEDYIMKGKVILRRKRKEPFFAGTPGYEKHLRGLEKKRDQDVARRTLMAEHGRICSFLVNKYPECQVVQSKHQFLPGEKPEVKTAADDATLN